MQVKIDTREVLRYLGCKGQTADSQIACLVAEAIDEVTRFCDPRYIYRLFGVDREEGGLKLRRTSVVLTGRSIERHVRGAASCAVMAVTVGAGIDRLIQQYAHTHLTRSLVVDACATAAVESVCDAVEDEIRTAARKKNLCITRRFSPGYGDLPVELQPDILRVLDAHKKIGLAVTDSCMLTPSKSVTAIIGLSEQPPGNAAEGCSGCTGNAICRFRREGTESDA
jgi:hypothetical protein